MAKPMDQNAHAYDNQSPKVPSKSEIIAALTNDEDVRDIPRVVRGALRKRSA